MDDIKDEYDGETPSFEQRIKELETVCGTGGVDIIFPRGFLADGKTEEALEYLKEHADGETPYEEWICENCLAIIDAELWECSCSRRWSWSDVPSVMRHCADCAPNTFPKLFYVKNQNGVENTYWAIDGQILYEDKNWKFTAPCKPSEAAAFMHMRKCPRCP